MNPQGCLPSGFLHRRGKMFLAKIKVPSINGRVKRKDVPALKKSQLFNSILAIFGHRDDGAQQELITCHNIGKAFELGIQVLLVQNNAINKVLSIIPV